MMWNNIGLKPTLKSSSTKMCLRMMWNNIGLKPPSQWSAKRISLRMMWNNIGLKQKVLDMDSEEVWEWCEII